VAELNGLPGYPFAVVPHPIADDDDAQLAVKAEAVAARVVALLTRRE
jgi:hypothetical protein